jgi:hypothetical protein
MRIAISGAHGTGKTSLAERLADALPGHLLHEEPYYALEAEGRMLAIPPSLADFESQLERSSEIMLAGEKDCVFDRCPVDFLAYLTTHKHADRFDPEVVLPRVRQAMNTLDIVFFTPIEHPDRIDVPVAEGRATRRRVDEALHDLLLENRLGLTCAIQEVTGTLDERRDMIRECLRARGLM